MLSRRVCIMQGVEARQQLSRWSQTLGEVISASGLLRRPHTGLSKPFCTSIRTRIAF